MPPPTKRFPSLEMPEQVLLTSTWTETSTHASPPLPLPLSHTGSQQTAPVPTHRHARSPCRQPEVIAPHRSRAPHARRVLSQLLVPGARSSKGMFVNAQCAAGFGRLLGSVDGTCARCPAHTNGEGGFCRECPGGKVTDRSEQAACGVLCTNGTRRAFNASATGCVACPAGTRTAKVAQRGNVACTACGAGTYSPTDGAGRCKVCPTDTFQPNASLWLGYPNEFRPILPLLHIQRHVSGCLLVFVFLYYLITKARDTSR